MERAQRIAVRTTAVLAAVVAGLVVASSAAAHARLLRAVPGDGTTVARTPGVVRLVFDDPVRVARGIRAVDSAGRDLLTGAPRLGRAAGGRELLIPVRGGRRPGEVSVLWRVVSDDGHLESGVVTFGVGAAPRRPLLQADTTVPAGPAVFRFTFFLGLLLAAGAGGYVITQGRRRVRNDRRRLALLAVAYALALVGAGGLAVGGAAATRFELAYRAAAAIASLGLLASLVAFRRPVFRVLAFGAGICLVPVPALAGHALDAGAPRALNVVLDVLHVAAASLWTGGVALLLLDLAGRSDTGAEAVARAARLRRFSAAALASVALLAATGLGRARFELATPAQAWSTGYGRILLGKSLLLLVLVVFGWRNRRRIAAGSFARRAWQRPLTAELALLAAGVAGAALLTSLAPGVARQAAARPAGRIVATGPVRLPAGEHVVEARQAGDLAVVLWADPGRRRGRLRVSVIDPEQRGVSGLAVDAVAAGRSVPMTPCGFGCYAAGIRPTRALVLRVARPGRPAARLAFRLPASTVEAAALVARASRAYRSLRSLTIHERLASSARDVVHATYQVAAPDRLAYAIAGGPAAVIVGRKRWDRARPAGRWRVSPQSPLREPEPFWGDGPIRDAHVLATRPAADGAVLVISFFAPAIPAWFTIEVDTRTWRTTQLDMIAAAHFMHHRYSGFDLPAEIEPPTA